MMTSAQVVETSVNVTSNSPSQDYTHPDDHNLPNYEKLILVPTGLRNYSILLYDMLNWDAMTSSLEHDDETILI